MNTPSENSAFKARQTAVRTLLAVTLKKRPLDQSLGSLADEAGLNARDRAFCYNLVMTSLRTYGGLNHILEKLLKNGLPQGATWTRAALIAGLAQIIMMRTADHAAVHETVAMIKTLPGKEKGFTGLVNAVLRRAVRERDHLQAELSQNPSLYLPAWLKAGWTDTYGPDATNDMARMLESTPPLDLTLKPGEDLTVWAKKLEAEPTPTGSLRRPHGDVTALAGYGDGHWWVQDMAASLPAKLLGDVRGKTVLDLCAAPGGKTMQLTAAGADVIAVDRNANRLKRLEDNLSRTALKAEVHVADAASFIPKRTPDLILLDAPCSATGTFRRNPDVLWTKGDSDIKKLAALQSRILDHAFSLLPKGGTLVYSVCSLESEEGKGQIQAFLARTPDAEAKAIAPLEVGGLDALITPEGHLLCLPCHLAQEGGMDGFFAARIVKKSA